MRFKKKGRTYKTGLIILVALLAIGLVGSAFVGSLTEPKEKAAAPPSQQQETPAPAAQTQEEQYSAIIKQLEEEVAANPKSISALKGLARTRLELAGYYSQQGNEQQSGEVLIAAQTAYVQALAVEPDNADILAELALTLSYLNKGQEALDTATKAVQTDPGSVLAHYYRGVILAAQGNNKGAIQECQTVIQIAPDSEVASLAKQLIKQMEAGN